MAKMSCFGGGEVENVEGLTRARCRRWVLAGPIDDVQTRKAEFVRACFCVSELRIGRAI